MTDPPLSEPNTVVPLAPMAMRARDVGAALGETLRTVIHELPDRPTRPSMLAKALGLNRATASKLLAATAKADPLELLHGIPGPEPLRSLLQSAASAGVDGAPIADALAAVEAFDRLIRVDAGTRGALDAVISSALPGVREKLELASKYSVFKGMSQLKGVQADTWIGAAIVSPSAAAPLRHDLTWLTGALGIQRLRSDTTVAFSYRYLSGKPNPSSDEEFSADSFSSVPMEQFCTNEPARVLTQPIGGELRYTLPADHLGRLSRTDMLVVDEHAAAMNRNAYAGERIQSSLFAEPAFPVTELVFDMFLHDEAFPGAKPELAIYDTGTRGIANVNDASRDIDRVQMNGAVEPLGRGLEAFGCDQIPRYQEMLAHLAERKSWDLSEYRGYRVRIQYPVYGWQISMAFTPPIGPKS